MKKLKNESKRYYSRAMKTEIWNKILNSFTTEVVSYRNQSIDLQSKSKDWFLYDIGLCCERVKPGIVKPCQANFLIKHLLEDQSAASDDSQINIFHRY